jgi:hypothetical protein
LLASHLLGYQELEFKKNAQGKQAVTGRKD